MTTHIAVVLDRSGSMKRMETEAAGSVNAFITSLNDIEGSKSVTINQFDHIFESVCSGVAPKKVPTLVAGDNYNPRGNTALYDAIGKTIEQLGKKKNVVVCIVTDGAENASHDYDYTSVKKLIDEKTNKGWKFEFLASDIKEAWAGGHKLVGAERTQVYADNLQGYQLRSATMTSTVADYMQRTSK